MRRPLKVGKFTFLTDIFTVLTSSINHNM